MDTMTHNELSETILTLFKETVANNMPIGGETAYEFRIGESYEATYTDRYSKAPIVHMSIKPTSSIPSLAETYRITEVTIEDNRRLGCRKLDTLDVSVSKSVNEFLMACARYTPSVCYDTVRPNHLCFSSKYKEFDVTLSVNGIFFVYK